MAIRFPVAVPGIVTSLSLRGGFAAVAIRPRRAAGVNLAPTLLRLAPALPGIVTPLSSYIVGALTERPQRIPTVIALCSIPSE